MQKLRWYKKVNIETLVGYTAVMNNVTRIDYCYTWHTCGETIVTVAWRSGSNIASSETYHQGAGEFLEIPPDGDFQYSAF